ncbi:hypothetical protein, partial [Cellulomonas massiliensis]|uniref:hypothetical protein n=1 Tax=Cellulomonas massiliensis TaxID=1465811 RepID=UPI00058BE8C9
MSDTWGDGVRLLTGARPTAVEGQELERAVRLLHEAAAALAGAEAAVRVAAGGAWPTVLGGALGGEPVAIAARRSELVELAGRARLAVTAERARELARRVQVVLGWYDDAEGRARGARGAVGT